MSVFESLRYGYRLANVKSETWMGAEQGAQLSTRPLSGFAEPHDRIVQAQRSACECAINLVSKVQIWKDSRDWWLLRHIVKLNKVRVKVVLCFSSFPPPSQPPGTASACNGVLSEAERVGKNGCTFLGWTLLEIYWASFIGSAKGTTARRKEGCFP